MSIQDMLWTLHRIGDTYTMDDKPQLWKIAYYPLEGTWKNKKDSDGDIIWSEWIDFEEPRALIESPMIGGTDFREIPLRYLTKASEHKSPGIKQYKQQWHKEKK